MPAELALRCTSASFGSFNVDSYTTAKKKYRVVIDPEGRNTCDCIAFVMKRNKMGGLSAIGDPDLTCKHIQAMVAVKGGCGWNSVTGIAPKFDTICPVCSDYTEEYDTRNPDTVNLDELMADFLALSKKLKAKK